MARHDITYPVGHENQPSHWLFAGDIVAVGIGRSFWLHRPVVMISREQVRRRFGDNGKAWTERTGLNTEWRRMRNDEVSEVNMFLSEHRG